MPNAPDPIQASIAIYEMPEPRRSLLSVAQRLGVTNDRNIVWSWYEPRNFGDWIGPYLYLMTAGKMPLYYPGRSKRFSQAKALLTVGSILRHIKVDDIFSVWGSGIISREDTFARPLEVHAVRGPRSRDRLRELGYKTTEIFGDPAILMPYVLPMPKGTPRYEVGIIPHYITAGEARRRYEQIEGVRIIDVTRRIDQVIEEIVQCRLTLSSSLHGLILSHAYGIPSNWIESEVKLQGDNVKFQDYLESCGLRAPDSAIPLESLSDLSGLKAAGETGSLADHRALAAQLWETCPFTNSAIPTRALR